MINYYFLLVLFIAPRFTLAQNNLCKATDTYCLKANLEAMKNIKNPLESLTEACSEKKNLEFLNECSFMARKEGTLLPENWHLISTGAEFIKEHAVTRSVNNTNKQLAVLDDGLNVKDNPLAEAKLKSNSKGQCYGTHGTAVISFCASSKFGVNPNAKIKNLPVKLSDPENGVFDSSSLTAQYKKFAEEDDLVVGNFSHIADFSGENGEYVKKAIEKDRWLVYGSGNSGNNRTDHDFANIKSDNIFMVGSYSYLNAPDSFSNYGKDIDIYFPGSQLQALNADYNPKNKASNPELIENGTSFAAPQATAVLFSMKSYAPEMSSKQAKTLLKMTGFSRGNKNQVTLANIPLAYTTLEKGRDCLKFNDQQFKDCLVQNIENIKASAELPKKPDTDNCSAWENYYKALAKNYFLSAGDKVFSNRINELYSSNSERANYAETIMFNGSANLNQSLEKLKTNIASQNSKDENLDIIEDAQKFFNGEKDSISTLNKKQRDELYKNNKIDFFSRLPTDKENVENYLGQCKHIFLGDKNQPTSMDCVQFFTSSSNQQHQSRIVEKLLSTNEPFTRQTALNTMVDNAPFTNTKFFPLLLELTIAGEDNFSREIFGSTQPYYKSFKKLSKGKEKDKLVLSYIEKLRKFAKETDLNDEVNAYIKKLKAQ